MPRRIGFIVIASIALLVAGPAGAGHGGAPSLCRKSDRCTLSGGDADSKAGQPDSKVRHETVKNSIGNVR
jgi:hypothetical protein